MGTIQQKLAKVESTKAAIRNAIVAKGQSVPESTKFSDYPTKISAIQTGADTADATATAGDILSGKTAYVKGSKITGAIASKAATDMTASGATVTAPAGYYPSAASKSVATATQATPSVAIDTAGKITATATQTAGYVAAGTKTGTKQLTTQAAKIVTPTTSEQTAVASGVYTTGIVKVAAMSTATQATPSLTLNKANGIVTGSATQTAGYVAAGTKSGTLQLTTQAAATITPGTAAKTAVAADRYTLGSVQVAGDANLIPANIKSGVSIFGVDGTMQGVEMAEVTITNDSPKGSGTMIPLTPWRVRDITHDFSVGFDLPQVGINRNGSIIIEAFVGLLFLVRVSSRQVVVEYISDGIKQIKNSSDFSSFNAYDVGYDYKYFPPITDIEKQGSFLSTDTYGYGVSEILKTEWSLFAVVSGGKQSLSVSYDM